MSNPSRYLSKIKDSGNDTAFEEEGEICLRAKY